MKVTKNTIRAIAIFIVLFAIYNIIVFTIPFTHNNVFWAAYIFGVVAFIAQIGVAALSFVGADVVKKKFYAIPIMKLGVIYLIIQLIISLVFFMFATFIEDFPVWIVATLSIVLLGVFIILVLLSDATRDNIIKIEDDTEQKTEQIRTFRINTDRLLRRAEDKDLKKSLEKLADIAKYSDPVSSEELQNIESEITEKIRELESLINLGNTAQAIKLADNICILFEDRNAMCKAYKKR